MNPLGFRSDDFITKSKESGLNCPDGAAWGGSVESVLQPGTRGPHSGIPSVKNMEPCRRRLHDVETSHSDSSEVSKHNKHWEPHQQSYR